MLKSFDKKIQKAKGTTIIEFWGKVGVKIIDINRLCSFINCLKIYFSEFRFHQLALSWIIMYLNLD